MEKCKCSQKKLLRERIEKEYEDFKISILQLDGEDIFALAPTIAAYKDVYSYMIESNWADEDEAEFLFIYETPLKLLASVWEEETDDRGVEFGEMLTKAANEDFTESYISVEVADELRDKYGDDIPLETAVFCEFIELAKILFNF